MTSNPAMLSLYLGTIFCAEIDRKIYMGECVFTSWIPSNMKLLMTFLTKGLKPFGLKFVHRVSREECHLLLTRRFTIHRRIKGFSDTEMLNNLYESMTVIQSRYSNCGFLVTGDFNRLNTLGFRNTFKLKQIVPFPTRGTRTLDCIFTNLSEYYAAVPRPAFGLSDHLSVELQPLARFDQAKAKRRIISRDLRASNKAALSSYLENINIKVLVASNGSCEEKLETLENVIKVGLAVIMPLKARTVVLNEAPWVTTSLKSLIHRRQMAMDYRSLRNRINHDRKACRSKYYAAKVQHLKECKP